MPNSHEENVKLGQYSVDTFGAEQSWVGLHFNKTASMRAEDVFWDDGTPAESSSFSAWKYRNFLSNLYVTQSCLLVVTTRTDNYLLSVQFHVSCSLREPQLLLQYAPQPGRALHSSQIQQIHGAAGMVFHGWLWH